MSRSLFSLEGMSALITGGNRGLGRGIALGLRAAGAVVAVTGRDPDRNRVVAGELGREGMVLALDVRDEDAVAQVVSEVVARFGSLDILVNNAGVARGAPVLDTEREDWDATIETNLTGAFLCAKHAGRAMVEAGRGGKIINVASIYSIYGAPRLAHYGSSKAGLLGLTRSLAIELAPHNIQVNAILPGWCETDMTREEVEGPLGEDIRRKTPAGRWGQSEDLVGAAVFLASAASAFVTGISLPVDGGYLISERFSPN
ncbi:MAG: glucose 1-dehydrogenase [Acidimicrobiia bacterium]